MNSIKELREKAWRNYQGDANELSDEQLRLIIEWRIFENDDRPKRTEGSSGWHSLNEAERRPSMVPFLVSLKLQGLI